MTQSDDTDLHKVRWGTILRARNGDVMRYDETGIVMRLSDRVIADIAARLPQGPAVAAPVLAVAGHLDADLLGDIDAWNLRQQGDWYVFAADLAGEQGVRQYRRRVAPEADEAELPVIADAPGAMLGILTLGGARAARALPRTARYPHHILAPGDDIGAVGMAGVAASTATAQPMALREITRDALLAEVLLSDRHRHHRALPLYLVRAETDGSATMAAMREGVACQNLLMAARNLAGIAASLAKPARILAVRLDYSLEDISGDSIAYRDGMLALMAKLTRDLGALSFRKPVFVATFECGTARTTDGPVLRAQWELAWNSGGHDLIFTAPGYMFAQDDYARLTDTAMVEAAEMDAAALTAIYADTPWFCPTFLLAEREGDLAIRVKARAITALVLDADDPFGAGVAAGFRLEGANNGAAIINVALAADDPQDVILTCDRPPEGTALHLLYGFGATARTGARAGAHPAACGAMRDDWQAESATGTRLHRWALPCALPVH